MKKIQASEGGRVKQAILCYIMSNIDQMGVFMGVHFKIKLQVFLKATGIY